MQVPQHGAVGLLYPRIIQRGKPRLLDEPRRPGGADFFTATEGCCPGVFGLLPMTGGSVGLTDRLTALPPQALALGYDTNANTTLLEKRAFNLLAAGCNRTWQPGLATKSPQPFALGWPNPVIGDLVVWRGHYDPLRGLDMDSP
ncbi:hypothetical protein ACFQ7J_23230 [Streptomyces sp. NPDC056501]|uniref:hypothetical protein n=1 Tax=Streptomyces sp. NPDC056501 TaxID=3345841 RepID=UPI0036CC9056